MSKEGSEALMPLMNDMRKHHRKLIYRYVPPHLGNAFESRKDAQELLRTHANLGNEEPDIFHQIL